MHVRMHNDMTTKLRLAGQNAEYIDIETIKAENSIDHTEDDGGFRDRSANDYLANLRAKDGN